MGEPRVHGVLVTYQRPHELERSLAALDDQTRPIDTLVIVDNDPTSSLPPEVLRRTSTLVVQPGDNLGPAGGIAVGMGAVLEHADDDDWILILDDDDPLVDVRVVSDLLGAVDRAASDQLGGIGLRGATLDRRSGRLRRARPAVDGMAVAYLKSDWAPLYRVGAVRAVGTFRRDLFFGFDDFEFGCRLVHAGFAVEAHPLGRVDTDEAPMASRAYRRSPWRSYYTTRNLIVILWSYGYRRAALTRAFLLCVAKPAANLLLGPQRSVVQARALAAAGAHAIRGTMGRTMAPETAKFSGDTPGEG